MKFEVCLKGLSKEVNSKKFIFREILRVEFSAPKNGMLTLF